jgi:DNA-directed RNA polymerase specialized sigma24 family protein
MELRNYFDKTYGYRRGLDVRSSLSIGSVSDNVSNYEIDVADYRDRKSQFCFDEAEEAVALLNHLPERERVMVRDVIVNNQKMCDVAAAHAISKTTVQTTIQKALAKLARWMGDDTPIEQLRHRPIVRAGVTSSPEMCKAQVA